MKQQIQRWSTRVLLRWICLGLLWGAGQFAWSSLPPEERTRIDITGNWRDTATYEPALRTRDPYLQEPDTKTFEQKLHLPVGRYTLQFEYDPFWDTADGRALGRAYELFQGLKVNGTGYPLAFAKVNIPEPSFVDYRKEPWQASCIFEVTDQTPSVSLSLTLGNLRPLRTLLISESPLPEAASYRAISPAEGGELLVAHGVPFLVRKLQWFHCDLGKNKDQGTLRPWENGYTLACGGVPVKTAYFLGMIHNIDIGNGSWYSPKGDHGYSHFVGDKAGTIVITYTDGTQTEIPIIFGFNLWFARPWDMIWHYNWYWDRHVTGWIGDLDKNLFSGIDAYRDIVRNSVAMVDGVRAMGSASSNTRFIFTVDMENRPIASICITGTEDLYDYPLIGGVTLETTASGDTLKPLPAIAAESPEISPVSLAYIKEKKYEPSLEALKHLLYTYVDEVPQLTRPEIPEGYIGPRYDFNGAQEAIRAATYLYYNGPGSASFIADSGMGCSSQVFPGYIMQYMTGAGFWFIKPVAFGSLTNWFKLYREKTPGDFSGGNNAWTRGIGELLRESMAFGYDKYVNTYIDWLDKCLMTEANPPHWNRIAGSTHATYTTKVGDIEERGNRENDGHGICMWGRYMIWHWLGRPKEWNEKRWPATQAAADWIQWQLDTDTIRPGVDKDVLYTESECAHNSYDFYSSYNCLHGLKLSIRMAQQLGHADKVEQWTKLYNRLQQGILDHLVDKSDFGPIWHTEANCDWQDHAHKLAHLQLATEGDTYTPLQDYQTGKDAEYLKIDMNTYQYLMKDKNYNCLRMYGYGQGMMTQAALLMDQMADTEQFIKMMVDHCYLPRFGRWASPEGIILHRSGKYYLPVNGYMGQDSHIADSTKAVRLMLGVDDNNPAHLRLVPRFPAAWEDVRIKDFPVLIGNQRVKLSYTYQRSDGEQVFDCTLNQPAERLSLRLGPIPTGRKVIAAVVNGRPISFENLHSGDSDWIWIRDLSGAGIQVKIQIK